jgi:DNA-binding transcriptional LysR family regulator
MVHRADSAFQASFATIRCNACIMSYAGDLLEHLRSFTVLAAHVERRSSGAFARAASELAVDVSVLRRRIQALTDHVGAPLVDGRGTAMRITKIGERTRELAGRALESVELLVAAKGARDVGPLRVACTGTFLAEVLPPVLAVVRGRHPGLRFRVRREGATASRELLAHGEIDFAIVRSTTTPEALASKRLGRDRLWLATRKDNALASASRITAEAMAREPLVGYSNASSTMRRIMEVLRPHGGAPWVEVDGKTAALRYVAAGLGIAFVSLLEGQRPSHPRVVVRDVTAHFPPVSFNLVWSKGRELRGFEKTFADELVAAC